MVRALTPKLAGLLDKGLASYKTGDIETALKSYSKVLKKRPSQPDALWLKGVAHLALGQTSAAVGLITRAAKLRPNDPAILNDLGMAYEADGNLSAARDAFNRALSLDPAVASAQVNVARCALADGRHYDALEGADRAIALQPSLGSGHNIRGLALKAMGRKDEALAAMETALVLEPNAPEVLVNKGELLRELGDKQQSQFALEKALTLAQVGSVDWVNATMTLGLLFAQTNQHDQALDCYNSVLALVPGHYQTLVNRGELYQSAGNIEAAEQDYSLAINCSDSAETAKFNLSRIRLIQQSWSEGWDLYESRWETEEFLGHDRSRSLPPWDGSFHSEELKLLVWGEQGLGDQILFASQIGDLAQKDITPILEVDPRLAPLVQRSFPDLCVYAYGSVPADTLDLLDAQIPVGSLGRFLRRKTSDFDATGPFLIAEANRADELRRRYLTAAQGRKVVGIGWHSVNPSFGAQKSLPLEQWAGVLSENKGAFFVALQYGDVEEEVRRASGVSGAEIFVDPDVDQILDFEAAAAQVAAMDLVISTSNTAVHLAGALGVPTWVMVSKVPEWRWGLAGETTPWYESVRVYRQSEQGDWGAVLTAVNGDLKRFLTAG